METLAERLQRLIEASPLSVPEIARRIGVTKQTLYNITSGTTAADTLRASTLLGLAELLGVAPAYLMHGGETPAKAPAPGYVMKEDRADYSVNVEIPLWDARAAAGITAINEHGNGQRGSLLFRERSLRKQGITPEAAHCFYVTGDSMAPRVTDGAVVLFDTTDTQVRSGKVYVIQWGEDTLLKRLFREAPGTLRITSDNKTNPEYQDRVVSEADPDFRVLGRMRWYANWDD